MKTKIKHTPAPWEFREITESHDIGFEVHKKDKPTYAIACIYHDMSKEESKANKDLITAAPELLEALEDARVAIYKLLRGNILVDPDNYLDGLDGIINKAKGL